MKKSCLFVLISELDLIYIRYGDRYKFHFCA